MKPLGKLTRQLETGLGRLLGTQPADASEPLDVLTGILHDVEQRVEPVGGGRRVFPFTRIAIVILCTRKEDQDRYTAALGDLDARIRERLRELACDPPAALHVDLQFARKPRKSWTADQRVEILFSRDAPASSAAARGAARGTVREGAHPAVRIVILRGTATKRSYALEQAVIRFGRGEDHAESSGRTRRNDVAFLDDEDEVNRTVARAQAHVRFDPERREYRVFDDGSSNGTRIVREAEILTVTPLGPRGVRVASGDVIELGRARLRFDIES